METIIRLALVEYFLFYLFNYTLLFEKIKNLIKVKQTIYQVQNDSRYNLLYPLFCPLCFSFHLTWLLLNFQTFLDLKVPLDALFITPLISLILDNSIKALAKHGS